MSDLTRKMPELFMDRNLPASTVAARMGLRVRIRRIEAELTLLDVGRALGKSEPEVEAIEAGHNPLSAHEIVALCRVLNVGPSWFFDGLLN